MKRKMETKNIEVKQKKHRTTNIRYYTSVTGEKVSKPKKTSYQYVPKSDLEWLICPITHAYPKIPVLFDGHVFDQDALRKWFWKSLVHPMTGIKVTSVEAVPVPIWRYLILCLSVPRSKKYQETHLVFYRRKCNYMLAIILGKLALPNFIRPSHPDFGKKKQWTIPFPTNHVCLSITLLEPLISKHVLKETLHPLTLEELIHCPLTGLNPTIYSSEGNLLHWVQIKSKRLWKLNGIRLGSFDEWAALQRWRKLNIEFGEKKTVVLSSEVTDWMNQKSTNTADERFDQFKKLFPHFQFAPFELSYYGARESKTSEIYIREDAERVRERLNEIRLMKCDAGWKTLSEAWDGKFNGCGGGRQSPIQIMRESLGLPFVVPKEDNTYGEDFSFMKIQGTFQDKQLKDYQFCASDLRGTVWQNVDFSCCCFVDAQLQGVVFRDCVFRECVGDLYGAQKIRCTFE